MPLLFFNFMLIYGRFSNWKTLKPSIVNENNDINHFVVKLDHRKSDVYTRRNMTRRCHSRCKIKFNEATNWLKLYL